MTSVLLAVNGTLMRGLELNPNLTKAGGAFRREAKTAPCYRLWSIANRHPGMVRCREGGVSIDLEIWEVPAGGLVSVLLSEPAGLSVGKIRLVSDEEILGVLAEPYLCEGQLEITRFGGWRAYVASVSSRPTN